VIRRLTLWMLASVSVHAAVVAAVLALAGGTGPPMLFIDLVHDLLAAVEAPSGRAAPGDSPPPAASPGPPPRVSSRPVAPPRAASVRPSVAPSRETPTRLPGPAPVPPAAAERVTAPAQPVPLRTESPPPAPEPGRSMPEATPATVEPLRPEPALAAPLPPRPADPAQIGRRADGVASSGAGTGPATAARPADAGGAAPPAAGGGTTGGHAPTVGGQGVGAGPGLGARDGGVLALAVPGDGGGEAAEYREYGELVRRRIKELLTYPPSARRRGLSGTVEIEVEIESTGAIGGVRLAASSSHRVLDDAALDAVRGLRRVPFPPEVRPRALRVRLPVVFELR
jgi:periplasmic protein TonB